MNLEEKKNLVIQLYQEGKTQREIVKSAHMSVRDISKIIRKIEGDSRREISRNPGIEPFLSG
jgi:DNA-directed RNA polymerase specialized sigma subunit